MSNVVLIYSHIWLADISKKTESCLTFWSNTKSDKSKDREEEEGGNFSMRLNTFLKLPTANGDETQDDNRAKFT